MTGEDLSRLLVQLPYDASPSPEIFILIHHIPYSNIDLLNLSETESWTKLALIRVEYYEDTNQIIFIIDPIKR